MRSVKNLFAHIPAELPEELVGEILRRRNLRIERIVSRGHASAPGFWYDQDSDEWVLLVKGSARIGFSDGSEVALVEGDHLLIPRHVRHRVERTAPEGETVWLAVHFGGDDPGIVHPDDA